MHFDIDCSFMMVYLIGWLLICPKLKSFVDYVCVTSIM